MIGNDSWLSRFPNVVIWIRSTTFKELHSSFLLNTFRRHFLLKHWSYLWCAIFQWNTSHWILRWIFNGSWQGITAVITCPFWTFDVICGIKARPRGWCIYFHTENYPHIDEKWWFWKFQPNFVGIIFSSCPARNSVGPIAKYFQGI